jgi:hypothetical protein
VKQKLEKTFKYNTVITISLIIDSYYKSFLNLFHKDDEYSKKNGSLNNLDQVIELCDEQNGIELTEQNKPLFPDSDYPKATFNTAFMAHHDKIYRKNQYQQEERRTLNFSVKTQTNKLRFGKKIYEFYNAPITKFWQHVIIYMVFLICCSYMILVKTPVKPTTVEIFVLIYIFTFGLDKIREVYVHKAFV